MTKHLHLGFSLLVLGLALNACADLPVTCGVPDSTQACDCSDGRTGGTQTCRNRNWTACVCPGEPIPETDGSVDGAAATSGTGGSGGIGGDSGTGGVGGTDSGTDAGDDAATIDGGPDAGGTGGMGGTGGTGGSFPAAYTGPCTMNSDCGPDAICLKNPLMTDTHCAPHCDAVGDCPATSSGTAVVECALPASGGTQKVCRLPCFGAVCPTDLTCDGVLPLASYCY